MTAKYFAIRAPPAATPFTVQEKWSEVMHTETKALLMIDMWRQRVEVLRETMTQNHMETRDLLRKFKGSFGKLLCKLQQVQDRLAKVTQKKQDSDEKQSDQMIISIEKEIVRLTSTVEKVQKLKKQQEPAAAAARRRGTAAHHRSAGDVRWSRTCSCQ